MRNARAIMLPAALIAGLAVSRAQTPDEARARWEALSARIAQLPHKARRAEQALQAANAKLAANDIPGALESCDRALRLAAKETRDAVCDSRALLEKRSPAFRKQGPGKELDRLTRQAEEARRNADYDETLRLYADALARLRDFQIVDEMDAAFAARLNTQTAWLKKNAPKTAAALQSFQKKARSSAETTDRSSLEARYRTAGHVLDRYAEIADSLSAILERYTPDIRKTLKEVDEERYARVEERLAGLKHILEGTPSDSQDMEGWLRQADDTLEASAQALAILPAGMGELTGQCPEDIAEWIEQVLQERQAGRREEADKLVAQAVRSAAARLKALPGKDAKACVQAISALADALSPAQARHMLMAAAAAGLDAEALQGPLKARLTPIGFEAADDTPPPLPGQQKGDPFGFVFTDHESRQEALIMPRRIRVGNGLLPNAARPEFLLVPGGRIQVPDDEGTAQTLRNERLFYMATTETTWGLLADFYRELTEAQRKELTPDKAAADILAHPSSRIANTPATFARLPLASAFCNWLNRRLASSGSGIAIAPDERDRFDLPTRDQWRFAACLDLLVRARQDKTEPIYDWWKNTRSRLGWNASTLQDAACKNPGGWGFCQLFGNVSELTRQSATGSKTRRCGGSYEDAASPISSFPLYDREAREGSSDLGFRLVLIPASVAD